MGRGMRPSLAILSRALIIFMGSCSNESLAPPDAARDIGPHLFQSKSELLAAARNGSADAIWRSPRGEEELFLQSNSIRAILELEYHVPVPIDIDNSGDVCGQTTYRNFSRIMVVTTAMQAKYPALSSQQ